MSRKRQPLSENTRRKISEALTGRKRSKEVCKRLSECNKGKKQSSELILKRTEAMKEAFRLRGESPLKGIKLSEERKRKISNGQLGKKRKQFTDEHKENLSKAKSNRKLDPTKYKETLLKMKSSHIGHPVSENTRRKLLESQIGGIWYGNVKYYDTPQYCEKWTSNLRERVRAFFNYQCAECGTLQNGTKLHIHHVWYNKKLCCDDTPRSLVPLCASCHGKTHNDREYWSNHFQEMIDLYYGGKCWLTKEEYKSLTN